MGEDDVMGASGFHDNGPFTPSFTEPALGDAVGCVLRRSLPLATISNGKIGYLTYIPRFVSVHTYDR